MIHLGPLLLMAQAAVPPEPRVSFSGFVQPQYERRSADGDERDRTRFRRMVFTVDAIASERWRAQFQVDAGRAATSGDRPIIKNAYLQFTGWEDRGIILTIGNQKMPLSRGLLLSSAKRGLVERAFTGDRGFGSPGRAPGVKVEGWHREHRLYWTATLADSRQVPDADEIRVDGIAEAGFEGNAGSLAGGRLEFHPFGETRRDHGDFTHTPLRFTVGTAGYGWWNRNETTERDAEAVNARRVSGIEISGALRGGGWSIDAEYQRTAADAADGVVSLGLYRGGRVRLRKASVESGYMVVRRRLELLAAFDILNNLSFDRAWRRWSAGTNWYVRHHDVKISVMHRESFDERGVAGARSRITFIQAQFAF